MGTPVTDPKLLAVLNAQQGGASAPVPVTDPKLLAILNAQAPQQEEQPPLPPVKPGMAGGSMGSPLQQGMHGLGLAANSIAKGAGAAPAYLMDMATSPLRDTHAGIGRDINQLGYTVQKPSQLYNEAIDKLIPAQPQGPGEQATSFIGQMGGGMLGPALGSHVGPQAPAPQDAQLAQNLQAAGQNGVRVTPGEAHSGLTSRLVEGMAGKGKLAMKNQVLNQGAIDKLMHAQFGIPADQPFTPQTFDQLYQQAASAATSGQADAAQTLQQINTIDWARKAFQAAGGKWDASALTNAINNGSTLPGNLQTIGQLGGSFPKSMAMPQRGMPAALSGGHKAFGIPAALLGGLIGGHPAAGAIAAGSMFAPDAARLLATTPAFQNNLVNGTGALAQGMANAPLGNAAPALMQFLQQHGLFSPQQQYPPLQPPNGTPH